MELSKHLEAIELLKKIETLKRKIKEIECSQYLILMDTNGNWATSRQDGETIFPIVVASMLAEFRKKLAELEKQFEEL